MVDAAQRNLTADGLKQRDRIEAIERLDRPAVIGGAAMALDASPLRLDEHILLQAGDLLLQIELGSAIIVAS